MKAKTVFLTAVLLLSAAVGSGTARADQDAAPKLIRWAEYVVSGDADHVDYEAVYEYDEDGNLSATVFSTYEFSQGVNEPVSSFRTEYDADGREIGLPDDVWDSIGQQIPVDTVWFSEYDPVTATEQKDAMGRVIRITRTWGESDLNTYQFSYEYDEQGRFLSFCYEDLRDYPFIPATRNKGNFTYHEDGSREVLIEVRNQDIWIVGTLYYDSDGHLSRFDGRNVHGVTGPGVKIDLIYDYEVYDGVHGMYSAHIAGQEDSEIHEEYWASGIPKTNPMIAEPRMSHLPDLEDIAYGGDLEYDDQGNLVRANYYNYDGSLRSYIAFEYA